MNYFSSYMEYAGLGVSEPPALFHRWASVSIIGTLLGRQIWLPFGHSKIYPNQYIMFMGSPGSRKSTAINIGAKLLKETGYNRFASDRTSKERFLMDLQQFDLDPDSIDDLEMLTLDEPAEVCVLAEEFTDFIGHNNMEFLTMLTKLWDNPEEYTHPKIHGKSVIVTKPTVNILSGNTAQNFAMAFPAEALGSGFLSRMLLVYGEPTGRKVTFPPPPDTILKARLKEHLIKIKKDCRGPFEISPEAEALCTRIYSEFVEMDDHRFHSYGTRRFTHLLKLSMIIACADLRTTLLAEDVIHANTLLFYTEHNMPKALGEFGKSKFSDVANAILQMLDHAVKPVTTQELWKRVSKDLNKITELAEIMKNLIQAEKIQTVTVGKHSGYLPLKKMRASWDSSLLDESWLTEEEKLL